MTNKSMKNILLDRSVPAHIKSDYPIFYEFLGEYLSHLEEEKMPHDIAINLQNYRSIDTTLEEFLGHFAKEVMVNIPADILADKRLLSKHIKEFYLNKGNEDSYRFLFRAMFGEEIEFYYPKVDVLRASDGTWFEQLSIKVSITDPDNLAIMIGSSSVTGQTSGAIAVVESAIKFEERGSTIVELTLSNIKGTFIFGESLKATYFNSSGEEEFITEEILEIFTGVNITSPGSSYAVGDIFIIRNSDDDEIAQGIVKQVTKGNITSLVIDVPGINYNGTVSEITVFYTLTSDWAINGDYLVDTLVDGTGSGDSGTDYTAFTFDEIVSAQLVPHTGDVIEIKDSDTSFGSGASGVVSKVGNDGEILEVQLLNSGDSYDVPTATVLSSTGTGAEISIVGGGGSISKAVLADFPIVIDADKDSVSELIAYADFTGTGDGNAVGDLITGTLAEYPGRYLNEDGWLSSSKRLQDNLFYQDYSYVLKVGLSVDNWREVVKKVIHPAGFALFGEIGVFETFNARSLIAAIDNTLGLEKALAVQEAILFSSDYSITLESLAWWASFDERAALAFDFENGLYMRWGQDDRNITTLLEEARSTSAFVLNDDGTYTEVSSSELAIGTGIGLQVSEEVTNLFANPTIQGHTSWIAGGDGDSDLTANAGFDPTGAQVATVVENQNPYNFGSQFYQGVAIINTEMTISMWAYADEEVAASLKLNDNENNHNITIGTTMQRFDHTGTIGPALLGGIGRCGFSSNEDWQGKGVVIAWMQINVGSPAPFAIGTRNADAPYIVQSASLPWFGYESGDFYIHQTAEFGDTDGQHVFRLDDGTDDNAALIQRSGTGKIRFFVNQNGANVVNKTSATDWFDGIEGSVRLDVVPFGDGVMYRVYVDDVLVSDLSAGPIAFPHAIDNAQLGSVAGAKTVKTVITGTPEIFVQNVRTEGDSLMAGAYGNTVNVELAKLLGTSALTNTAVGGSEIGDVLSRVLDIANAEHLEDVTVFWDGSHNGLTTVQEYVDILELAINALGHNRFVVIPPITAYGSTHAGSISEQVAAEYFLRWPDNYLDWQDILVNTAGSIAQSMFHNAPTDPWHVSDVGGKRMAVGIKEFLSDKGWVTTPTLDPIIADGSVWLFDPSITDGAFAGVPADEDIIPNAAWQQAQNLLGSGDATTLGTHVDIYDNGVDLLLERTSNLGIHAILSQDTDYSDVGSFGNTQGIALRPNTLIQQYIDSTTTDEWYYSIWFECSRLPGDPPGGVPASNAAPNSLFHKADNTSNYHFHMQSGAQATPVSGGNFVGSLNLPDTGSYAVDGEPRLHAVTVDGYTGTQPALGGGGTGIGNSAKGLTALLGSGDAWSYFNNGGAPSLIAYRVYAENLTVSGRSHSDVADIDELLFNVAFGEGGTFYNDTFSDPDSTLP